MGKSKTTKFKRPQFNAVGLPVKAVREVDGEEEDHGEDCSPAAELLEKVFIYIYSCLSSYFQPFIIILRCLFKYMFTTDAWCHGELVWTSFSQCVRVFSASKPERRHAWVCVCQHFPGGPAEPDHPRFSTEGRCPAPGSHAAGQQHGCQGDCSGGAQVNHLHL